MTKLKMEKRIAELEREVSELKSQILVTNPHTIPWTPSYRLAEWSFNNVSR
jgi:hypothetical protein